MNIDYTCKHLECFAEKEMLDKDLKDLDTECTSEIAYTTSKEGLIDRFSLHIQFHARPFNKL